MELVVTTERVALSNTTRIELVRKRVGMGLAWGFYLEEDYQNLHQYLFKKMDISLTNIGVILLLFFPFAETK